MMRHSDSTNASAQKRCSSISMTHFAVAAKGPKGTGGQSRVHAKSERRPCDFASVHLNTCSSIPVCQGVTSDAAAGKDAPNTPTLTVDRNRASRHSVQAWWEAEEIFASRDTDRRTEFDADRTIYPEPDQVSGISTATVFRKFRAPNAAILAAIGTACPLLQGGRPIDFPAYHARQGVG